MNVTPFRRRAALGLRPAVVPVSLYVPLGIAVGPQALAIVSLDTLAHLDAAISVALSTLGVFVGLALARAFATWRLVAAAALESSVTVAAIAAAVGFLLIRWRVPDLDNPFAIALALGVCAAASSAGAAESGREADSLAARVADLDDIVPIVLAAAIVAALDDATLGASIGRAVLAVLLGAIGGAIGWLLFERADGAGERAVFVLGTLALIGGGSAFLHASPLLAGLVAGILWRVAPGHADRIIVDDVRKFHHPLLILLLLDAGAQLTLSPLALWLFVPFVVFRMSGKIVGGWAASRLVPGAPADIVGVHLVPPGVVGIAIALNIVQVSPSSGLAVLSAAVVGAVVFETIAMLIVPREGVA